MKNAAKNKRETSLRMTKKSFQDKEFPHELFLTTSKKIKTLNSFPGNMSIDTKLSKARLPKIIQPGVFLNNMAKKYF